MQQAISRKNLWEHSPRALKACVGRVLQIVPQRYLLGRRFREAFRFAEQAQWWPAERAREYQLDQLRHIVALAYEKTGYYQRSFRDIGFEPGHLKTVEDLARLPTINKDVLRENLDEMCTVSPTSSQVDYISTGGSSGMPLSFYIGADRSATEYAYLVASWQRVGYRTGMVQAIVRGRITEENGAGLYHEYDPILRRHYYSNFHMTDDNVRRYLDHIATIGPCYLQVYPSSANSLASCIQRQGRSAPTNILGILAGSENVYDGDRQTAERVLGVRYFSWYGHCEKLVLAAECEHSTAYHVWPTYGYCELLDNDGNPVTEPGQRGEIVGTGFINRVVPFIRYRTGDYATYESDRCKECGREHMILTKIEGRWPQGCLIAADGSMISMTAINLHDDTLENIVEYQFYQSLAGEAVFRIVPAYPLNDREKSRIIRRMNARLQGQVKLTLEICRELQKTVRGKLLRVVQEIPGAVRDGDPH